MPKTKDRFIVKVQVPLFSSAAEPVSVLVYNEDRSLQEMARRSNDVQKQKLGDKYPEEMSRRAKLPRRKREPKQGIGAKRDENPATYAAS